MTQRLRESKALEKASKLYATRNIQRGAHIQNSKVGSKNEPKRDRPKSRALITAKDCSLNPELLSL